MPRKRATRPVKARPDPVASAKAKAAIKGAQARAKRFQAYCQAHGLPRPYAEYPFWPGRKFRFDFAWFFGNTVAGVALECDGGTWRGGRHTTGAGWATDAEKFNEAQLRGWVVLRVTPQTLCTPATLRMIERAAAR